MFHKGTMFVVWLLLLLSITACQSTQSESTNLPLEACQLNGDVTALCGRLSVPENREAADSRTIDLNIAVLPATNSITEDDPLFLLAGGPGQAATEAYPLALSGFEDINSTRDIVLFDQRGTGASAGFSCAALEDENLETEVDPAEFVSLMQTCAGQLAENADLTRYTTDDHIADLEAVREALGYEQINVYGASYGTRAAMTYARRYPEHVRTLILDAVVGPDLILFQQMPRDGQRALEMLFARCADDVACQTQFPMFEQEFTDLLDQLATPQEIGFTHPLSGEEEALTLTQDLFGNYIFNILYSTDLVSLLPLLVHETHTSGDFGPLITQAFMVGDSAGVNIGLLYTVTCAEDAPFIDMEAAKAIQAETDFGLRAADFVEICAAWPETAVADDLHKPFMTDIPTLLLSGAADPVTPPSYAEAVAAALPNHLHLIVPQFGHGNLGVGCIPKIAAQFINDGSISDLEIDCVADIQPAPFFTSFAGPEP